ncbi:MAG TPA: autotransporter outer membrane beta-barrel domain-containing protein [Rhizomicrobium sp.]|nr:autotransporter outer membrane beta-barrel domain-containing protein [Rhizomicrobium sp.]
MKKQVLLLSVAVAALSAGSPAFAQLDPVDDITTPLTTVVTTATAGPNGTPADILLDTGGQITVTVAGPAVTINSDNSFDALTGTTISNNNTANATGILVDLTTQNLDTTNATGCGTATPPCHTNEGITETGLVDLTGTGIEKIGLWLEGPDPTTATTANIFTGNIDFTGSTMTITGDSSVGVQIDSLAQLNGNLTLGEIIMKPSSSTSTLGDIGFLMNGTVNGDVTETSTITIGGNTSSNAGTLIGMDIAGAINGNLTFPTGGAISVTGAGAEGILLTGSINPCNTGVSADCTSRGSFVNDGSITVLAVSGTLTAETGNKVASFAVGIGGNIAGGIYNAGASFVGDTTPQALISTQGVAPAVEISPFLEGVTPAVPIVIGVYAPATGTDPDPGFSFYNRGTIESSSSNENDSTQAIFIGGGTNIATTTLTGGFFNGGTISTAAFTLAGAAPTTAVALKIGAFGYIGVTQDPVSGDFSGDTYTITTNGAGGYSATYGGTKTNSDDEAGLVNSGEAGSGRIIATVSGASDGEADALLIQPNANVPSIINSGLISAVATTTDTINTTSLTARAIVDQSGTLNFIENNGTIAAAATTLDNDGQQAIAIDLSGDTEASTAGKGVVILNQATVNSSATITGDILFGSGDNQIVDVEGASTDHGAVINGDITYGGGSTPGSDLLIIGNFGTVTGTITSNSVVGVSVDIRSGGTLNLQNDTTALNVAGNATEDAFHVEAGGTLNLTLLEEFRSGIINSSGVVQFDTGAKLNLTYGSFIPSNSDFVLITAPEGDLHVVDLSTYQQQIIDKLPFLFDPGTPTNPETQLEFLAGANGTPDELVLHVVPKDAAALGLTGYAAQILPFANQALSNDDTLGAAFVAGVTSQKAAQLAYNQMAPDVSGGARAIAIALTDQSSGPVAARQRMLRMYGKQDGETTLWGEEFAEFVSDPGNRNTGQTGFKDHGFGFVLGLDGGDPKTGWYGGAFSFYSGDIVEPLPRDSHTNTLWYMFTGYTDWRGKGLFLDTKTDIGYMSMTSKRFIDLTIPNASGTGSTNFQDEADSKRPGVVGAVGMTTGAILAYGSTTFTPQLSLDGMTMREEGYTETHPGTSTTGNGKGMDLQTQAFYASSLRAFIGTEVREDLNLGDFFVQPDIRLGYRYDFLNDPTKLKVNFADVGTNTTATPGPTFTLVGPDPAQGNFVAGASIAATTDAWTLGANYDFVRGTNGVTTQIGTIHLLGRI